MGKEGAEEDHEALLFHWALCFAFFFAIATPLLLRLQPKKAAPYGRHTHTHAWGTPLPPRMAWCLMECPAFLFTLLVFSLGRSRWQLVPSTLLSFFLLHYLHRSFIYPLRMPPPSQPNMPLGIALMAFLFNLSNGYLQGRSLGHFRAYPPSWLSSPQFRLGALVFVAGMATNLWADSVLLSLKRSTKDRNYRIPRGGLYEYVTCPNYLGEMVEWLGWAIMTWSAAGLAFFCLTVSNLGPRAVSHHSWYLKRFPDYPRSRKILIPFIF